jgi:hypothetical protein
MRHRRDLLHRGMAGRRRSGSSGMLPERAARRVKFFWAMGLKKLATAAEVF